MNAALAHDEDIEAMAPLIARAQDVLYMAAARIIRWRWKAR